MLHLVPLLTKTELVWSISKAGGEEGSFADIYSLRSMAVFFVYVPLLLTLTVTMTWS